MSRILAITISMTVGIGIIWCFALTASFLSPFDLPNSLKQDGLMAVTLHYLPFALLLALGIAFIFRPTFSYTRGLKHGIAIGVMAKLFLVATAVLLMDFHIHPEFFEQQIFDLTRFALTGGVMSFIYIFLLKHFRTNKRIYHFESPVSIFTYHSPK